MSSTRSNKNLSASSPDQDFEHIMAPSIHHNKDQDQDSEYVLAPSTSPSNEALIGDEDSDDSSFEKIHKWEHLMVVDTDDSFRTCSSVSPQDSDHHQLTKDIDISFTPSLPPSLSLQHIIKRFKNEGNQLSSTHQLNVSQHEHRISTPSPSAGTSSRSSSESTNLELELQAIQNQANHLLLTLRWPVPHVDLFTRLALRGHEPMLPHWWSQTVELNALPKSLFTSSSDAYITSISHSRTFTPNTSRNDTLENPPRHISTDSYRQAFLRLLAAAPRLRSKCDTSSSSSGRPSPDSSGGSSTSANAAAERFFLSQIKPLLSVIQADARLDAEELDEHEEDKHEDDREEQQGEKSLCSSLLLLVGASTSRSIHTSTSSNPNASTSEINKLTEMINTPEDLLQARIHSILITRRKQWQIRLDNRRRSRRGRGQEEEEEGGKGFKGDTLEKFASVPVGYAIVMHGCNMYIVSLVRRVKSSLDETEMEEEAMMKVETEEEEEEEWETVVIASLDWSLQDHDVWNSLAVLILAIHVRDIWREYLQGQVYGVLQRKGEQEEEMEMEMDVDGCRW